MSRLKKLSTDYADLHRFIQTTRGAFISSVKILTICGSIRPLHVFHVISACRTRELTKLAMFLNMSVALCLTGCESNPALPKSGATPPATPKAVRQLRIAAAADLRFALDELVSAFQARHPDSEITVTPGSSGNLFAQLSNEAPFDLFLSADVDYPKKLIEQGQGLNGTDFSYATGHL